MRAQESVGTEIGMGLSILVWNTIHIDKACLFNPYSHMIKNDCSVNITFLNCVDHSATIKMIKISPHLLMIYKLSWNIAFFSEKRNFAPSGQCIGNGIVLFTNTIYFSESDNDVDQS